MTDSHDRDKQLDELKTLLGRLRGSSDPGPPQSIQERVFSAIAGSLDEVLWIGVPSAEQGIDIVFVGPAFERVWGQPAAVLYDSPLGYLDFIHPEDKGRVKRRLRQPMTGETLFDYRVVRPDGEVRWLSVRTLPIEDDVGKLICFVGIASDVTAEKVADLRRKEAENRWRTVLDAAPDTMLTMALDGTISYINRTGPEHSTRGEVEGQAGTGFIKKEDWALVGDAVARVRETGERQMVEVGNAAQDDSYECHIAPIRAADGSIREFAIAARNVTPRLRLENERRELEQRIFETRQLESLGVLAGGIAHQFNNLLATVMGNGELLQASLDKEDPNYSAVDDILTYAARGAKLTRQMLAYAGQTVLSPEPVDLSLRVSECLSQLDVDGTRIELVEELGRDIPPVSVDRYHVEQLVDALVSNALEALDGRSGRVTVRTKLADVPQSELGDPASGRRIPEAGRFVVFEVEDDGTGMTRDVLASALEPFFSTKFRGRGLGLAAAYGIARAHGGTIRLVSEPEAGTTCSVLFPVSR